MIKKLISLLFAVSTPFSQVLATPPGPLPGIGFTLETYHVHTKETLPPTSSEPRLLGVHLNYDQDMTGERFLRWHFFRTVGITQTQSGRGNGMMVDLKKDQQHELSMGVDYQASLTLTNQTSINPRVGIEYRRFFHGADSSGMNAYPSQKAYYSLIPVGLDMITTLSDNWLLQASGSYQYLVYSNQVAYASGNSLIFPTGKDIKANGFGTRVGSNLIYKMGHARFSFGAFVQNWHVVADNPHSEALPPSALAFMPNNQTRQIGTHVKLHF